MGKTIKEMAYNNLLKENVRSTESDYSRGYLKGYEKGANAVLKEIKECCSFEKYCQESHYSSKDYDRWRLNNILEKIKQLKGENEV